MDKAREWKFKALTPIWTGRVTRIEEDRRNSRRALREVIGSDRLISTGLLGSIRWWFEVLVRGLGGSACDPSDTACRDKSHCVVCELFGCTGWARKFRFQVLAGIERDELQTGAIKEGDMFWLRFLPMRHIAPQEWALLDLTLRLIADYGAIGGKTVLKPSDETSRAGQPHHKDYGIVSVVPCPEAIHVSKVDLEAYVIDRKWRKDSGEGSAWASLANFWCVTDKYLARKNYDSSTFNSVIGRPEPKKDSARNGDHWLAGQQGESKKVFSFKDPPRTFGFVKPGTVDIQKIKERLKKAWPNLQDDDILTGEKVLGRLLNENGKTP